MKGLAVRPLAGRTARSRLRGTRSLRSRAGAPPSGAAQRQTRREAAWFLRPSEAMDVLRSRAARAS